MAQDYLKVLLAMDIDTTVVCRTRSSAESFKKNTDHEVIYGDLAKIIDKSNKDFDFAIVAVDIENLFKVSSLLIEKGIKKLLVEKPGSLNSIEINALTDVSERKQADVSIAYNRRFYASALKAKEIIGLDNGVTSFSFEFTEWSHKIESLPKNTKIKENWFLANSSHVVDLAFFLGGIPKEMQSFISGKNKLSWHPSASAFSGSGITKNNATFSYQADWSGPGRWGVEIVTNKNRLIMRPLEKLQIQKKGSLDITFEDIDDQLDIEFKPGLFKQVEAFLNDDVECLCSLRDQKKSMILFNEISKYKS